MTFLEKSKTLRDLIQESNEIDARKEAINTLLDIELVPSEYVDKEFKALTLKLSKKEKELEALKLKLAELIRQWDNQGHLGLVLQETDWLLGEFGQLRKLLQ